MLQAGIVMQVIKACLCCPVQNRSSECPSPSSAFRCWCSCSHTKRALIVATMAHSEVRGRNLLRVFSLSAYKLLADELGFLDR